MQQSWKPELSHAASSTATLLTPSSDSILAKCYRPHIMETALQTIILGPHHFPYPFLQLCYVIDCE